MSSQLNQEVVSEWVAGSGSSSPNPTPEVTQEPDIPRPSIATILETVLGLREQELMTYDAIRAEPGASTKELASRLDRDRSNINRSLMLLEESGLVSRHRRILDSGGYFYSNYAAPPEVFREMVSDALGQWVAKAQTSVENYQWDTPLGSNTEKY